MKLNTLILAAALALPAALYAQEDGSQWRVTGAIQSDILFPEKDDVIGATKDNWSLTNTYIEASLLNKYFEAGVRAEYMHYPLPGFEPDFEGSGFPFFYAKGKYKGIELTAGSFYEQFGTGLILRTYEERALGIDNSLLGGRLAINTIPGVRIKALAGKQRRYWHWNDSWVWGGDLELDLDTWFKGMQRHDMGLTLGASFVSKNEDDEDISRVESITDEHGKPILTKQSLNLPNNVGSYDFRANLRAGNFNVLAEYARKSHDPSFDNGYIYRHGNALLLSGSYSKRGASILLQAKRSEDMAFRSRRSMTLTSSFINHLPAFTQQQTYALATLYPYATQSALGEWAFQGEVAYTFKKKTPLGGKYGTSVKINMSHVRSLKKDPLTAAMAELPNLGFQNTALYGTEGYRAKFGIGDEVYYQDINVNVEKRVAKDWKINLTYMHQRYNKSVVEGHGGTIRAHIGIAEAKWNISKKVTLRGEAQYLHTKQDQGDWWFGLLELSVLPNLMFTISDQYNAHVNGEYNDVTRALEGGEKVHYYQGFITYSQGSHRLQFGYGKTRAGYNCSGGVCRYVPAQKGATISYTYNF